MNPPGQQHIVVVKQHPDLLNRTEATTVNLKKPYDIKTIDGR